MLKIATSISAATPGSAAQVGQRWAKSAAPALPRVVARGKFLFAGGRKFYIRGVTYGPFRPTPDGCEYGLRHRVADDFAKIAQAGFNCVRVYTVPPRWLLDEAAKVGLRVFVGLPWEQHLAFLDDRSRADEIVDRLRAQVATLRGHASLLAIAIGNEVPAGIVRWHGREAVARFIRRLYDMVKQQDPAALVTYVNFPTTEYLELPFLDFVSFNVYLEDPAVLRSYLDRLQNLAADRPLVMGEIGLDSLRNGLERQAEALVSQIRTTFAAGCAGTFLFAWTDEWHRGGNDIEDWDFGLTDRQRRPKPALDAVARTLAHLPFPPETLSPRISVCVCTFNGAATIAETVHALADLDYPDYEVLVIDDGSRDRTGEIVRELQANLANRLDLRIETVPNGGLSRARNLGLKLATGEIIAYLDDDAFPDPHWLRYLAEMFTSRPVAGVGGPNLPVPGDKLAAECVAHSPGGPNHVLSDDTVAEHIPGCNMAFRRSVLLGTGGFDPQFRIAGDDVDLCWRVQEAGGEVGFHPAALVWHHRRNTLRGYLRQQRNYGRAEAMLEAKWPHKYNHFGHVHWSGRIYGSGLPKGLTFKRNRIYHGLWGSAPFQSLYDHVPGMLTSLPLVPELYLAAPVLLVVAIPAAVYGSPWLAIPLALAPLMLLLALAVNSAWSTPLYGYSSWERLKRRLLIAYLHFRQPWARLSGRLQQGLTPWRLPPAVRGWRLPRQRVTAWWSETWRSPEQRLQYLLDQMKQLRAKATCGGSYDGYDLELRAGLLGSVRLLLVIEEHGAGRQLVRLRFWPVMSGTARWLLALAVLLTTGMVLLNVPVAALGALVISVILFGRILRECGAAAAALLALRPAEQDEPCHPLAPSSRLKMLRSLPGRLTGRPTERNRCSRCSTEEPSDEVSGEMDPAIAGYEDR